MTTSALLMMLTTSILITVITVYFAYKVLKTPPKAEPDSYEFNDEDPR
jgi:hypothetical protein